MSEQFWTDVVFGIGFGLGTIILATMVLIVVIKYGSLIWQAKTVAAGVDEYRKVAEEATAVQERTVEVEEQIVREWPTSESA